MRQVKNLVIKSMGEHTLWYKIINITILQLTRWNGIYIYIYIYVSFIYIYMHTRTHTHTHIYVYVYKDISFIVTYMAVRITDRKQGKKINFLH